MRCHRKAPLDQIDFKTKPLKDVFGVNTFNKSEQRQMLPKPVTDDHQASRAA